VEEVELTDDFPNAIISTLLIDENHETWLQVGEEKTQQKSRHNE
jgi:hypothetical protein